jgi:glycosyltransferase involved in cell wall biosynthesis
MNDAADKIAPAAPAAVTAAVPFSALLVTCNDARRLRDCLAALAFCDDIVVVDLGSADGCQKIAIEAGARLLQHPRVPIVELIRQEMIEKVTHDWVIVADPDEVFPAGFEQELLELTRQRADLASVVLPWDFYFKGKLLRTTVWGMPKTKTFLLHRRRVTMSANVHTLAKPLEGFVTLDWAKTHPRARVRHYWIDTYEQLFEKHLRYLRFEGKARYDGGGRFSWFQAFARTGWELKRNLLDFRGILGGPRGWFLSCFYAWYVWMGWMSLRKHQNQLAPADRALGG